MLIFALLAFVVGGLATSLATSYDIVALGAFPLLWGLGLAITTAGRGDEEKRTLARLFTLSFLLRVALAIVIYRLGLVDILGDEDSSGTRTRRRSAVPEVISGRLIPASRAFS